METTTEIIASLAGSIGYLFQEGGLHKRSELEQLLDYLVDKRMLLVMDNAEHLQEAPSLFSQIRSHCRNIQLLVTSRERLQLLGEQLFPLQGLPLPILENQVTTGFVDYDAAQLFLNISRRNVPGFEPSEGAASQLLRICQLVEGMPLGLELAASWVGLMSLEEIANELEGSLAILHSQYQDVAERHQSMQASLDVSWNRLTGEQQQAISQLSVFRGGFTRSSALAVCGATLPLLVTLVNKSWLTYDQEADRYNAHELLRQYGSAKLGTDPANRENMELKHAAYFCGRLNEMEDAWFSPRQNKVVTEIKSEIDNVAAAWRWACLNGQATQVCQAMNILGNFYRREGRIKAGREAFSLAREALSQAAETAKDTTVYTTLARILIWQAHFELQTQLSGRYLVEGQVTLDAMSGEGKDILSEQAVLWLAMVEHDVFEDYDEAIILSEKALSIFKSLEDRRGEALAYASLGLGQQFKGEYQQAITSHSMSLELSKQLADAPGIAEVNLRLGLVARHLGDFETAKQSHSQSLKVFRQLGNRYQEMDNLLTLSYTYSWAGDFQEARDFARQAIVIGKAHGQYPDPSIMNPLCKADIHLGHYEEAKELGRESLKSARLWALPAELGWATMFLGEIALKEGDYDSAEVLLEESAAALAGINHIYRTLPQANMLYVQLARGAVRQAHKNLLHVLQTVVKARTISPVFYCLPVAAQIELAYARPTRALELLNLANRYGHVKNSAWFRDYITGPLANDLLDLPTAEAEEAHCKAKETDVWQAARQLLEESVP